MAVSAFYADFQFIFRTVCLHIVVSTAVICQPADHKGGGGRFSFPGPWENCRVSFHHQQRLELCGDPVHTWSDKLRAIEFFLDGARSSFLREKIVGEGVPVLLYLAGHGGPWENCRVLFHHQPTWSDWPEGHGNLKG